ncbi:MAG: hypothetical protein ACC726_03250 [Chloroflexota bacterium]
MRLSSDAVSVLLVPDVGARIVSLRDRRTGREWLTTGAPPSAGELAGWAAEDAAFDGRASFGWDECLPTVGVCADPLDGGAEPLRDHGEQWGRKAPSSLDQSAAAIHTVWPASRWDYVFSRRLSLRDATTLLVEYRLDNTSSVAMPLLWSLHPCLRLEPGSRIELPSVDTVMVTAASGIDLQAGLASWPHADLVTTSSDADVPVVDLSRVRSGEGWATKLYAEAPTAVRAVTPDGASLSIDWDRAFAPSLGIWLAYGGWPVEGAPVEQLALEPTTSGHDDLAGALRDGAECVLQPGASLDWWVSIQLDV